jgi:polyphosphate kinase
MGLREYFVSCIRRETEHARSGQTGRIIAKVNSLVDPAVIEELYLASQAGVQIDLIVRGMCSLRPGVEGLSERIRVVSVIDRYLEHARIFYFQNNAKPEYLLSSADWMQRNFDHRVEIAFPVLDEQHQIKLKEILDTQLADSLKSWRIQSDGTSVRQRGAEGTNPRSQEQLYEIMRDERGGANSHATAPFD